MNIVKFEKKSNKTLREALIAIVEEDMSEEMLDTPISTLVLSVLPESKDNHPGVFQYAEDNVDLITVIGLVEYTKSVIMESVIEAAYDEEAE